MALAADRQDRQQLARYFFSGIYNMRYYQGIADTWVAERYFYSYLRDINLPGSEAVVIGDAREMNEPKKVLRHIRSRTFATASPA